VPTSDREWKGTQRKDTADEDRSHSERDPNERDGWDNINIPNSIGGINSKVIIRFYTGQTYDSSR